MIGETIIAFLFSHGIILSFVGGFVTGETVIITLAALSANGYFPIWYVLVFSTLGMYLSDFIPFIIGKSNFWKKIISKSNFGFGKRLENIFLRVTKGNLFLTLFYTKFIYGASIPALVYLGYKKLSYRKFALYNLLVEIIFVPIVVLIGWLSGKGFKIISSIFRETRIAILFIVIFVLMWFLIRKWLNSRFIKKRIQ